MIQLSTGMRRELTYMHRKELHIAPKVRRKRSSVKTTGSAPSAQKEFVQEFRELGFTEYEAKAYLTLCQASPATAYEVSKIAGLAKANVYTALEGLAQRGAVQPVSKEPVKYVPVQPSRLLGQIAKMTSARCKDLTEKLNRIAQVDGTDYVWTINGDDDIRLQIDEMINRARQHVWIKAPEQLLERHAVPLLRAAKRGVAMLIVLFGSPDSLSRFCFGPNCRVYLHEGSGVMIGPARQLVTLAIDFAETLTANMGELSHGAYTKSSPVVYMAESLIRHEVYLAEIFQEFRPQIEKRFGPALVQLREHFLPVQYVHELKQILTRQT